MNLRTKVITFLSAALLIIQINRSYANANSACEGMFAKLGLADKSDPILRATTRDLTAEEINSESTKQLIVALKKLMKKKGGVGIAAPQAGESLSLVIIKHPKKGELALINPKVTKLDDSTSFSFEGCLSLPGRCGIVSRQKKIEVDYLDENGISQSVEETGFAAIMIQHEVDHLNGILYVDRSGATARKLSGIGRTSLWELDADGKVLLSKFFLDLNETELQAFQKYFKKSLEKDIAGLGKDRSVTKAFFELDNLNAKNAVLGELLDSYQLLVGNLSLEQKVSQLNKWAKSDIHALYLRDLLEKSPLPEAQSILAKLETTNPHFDFIRLPGIRGPPITDTTALFNMMGASKPIHFSSVQETIEFARLASKYKFQTNGNLIGFILHDGSKLKNIQVQDTSMAFAIAKHAEEFGPREALKQNLKLSGQRFLGGNGNKKITYGLEVEVDFRENTKLLDVYRIEKIPEAEWLAMTTEQRLHEMDQLLTSVSKKNTNPFVKVKGAPEWMPNTMDAELDGNGELNGIIFNTIDEVRSFVKNFTEKYGSGYWQGHIVFPKDKDLKGLVGYSILEGDTAQLKSLENGYFKYLSDDTFVPGRFLTHHSLGPLSETNRQTLLKLEKQAAKGKSIGSASEARINNGPALRDDKYPDGHVGFELRQFHKRGDQLVDALDDLSLQLHHGGNLDKLADIGDTELVSEKLINKLETYGASEQELTKWKSFLAEIQTSVKKKYSNLAIGAAPIQERFLLPLRNWENHPAIKAQDLPIEEQALLKLRIDNATREYASTMGKVMHDHENGTLTLEDAIEQSQIAASKWAYDAQISPMLMKFKKQSLLDKNSTLEDVLQKSGRVKNVETIYSTAEKVHPEGILSEEKKFNNGKKYDFYNVSKKDLEHLGNSNTFKKNSVEVMFQEASPYGHIRLRVGENVYTFNFSRDAKYSPFDYKKSVAKSGYVFFVPADKIASVEADIKRIYYNSQNHNLPPFDPNSSSMGIRGPPDKLEYNRKIHSIYSFMSNNSLDARLIEKDGKKLLVTPDNFQYPVDTTSDGTMCVQSLSCATSATYVLKKFFDIDIDFMHGAKSLRDTLENGNLNGTSPDAIIHY